MWKVKYQLALHLRGQYHYPLTGKAEKTHSSSGIIKLSQWKYKVSSSLSWLPSSAIWERYPFYSATGTTALTSHRLLRFVRWINVASVFSSNNMSGWFTWSYLDADNGRASTLLGLFPTLYIRVQGSKVKLDKREGFRDVMAGILSYKGTRICRVRQNLRWPPPARLLPNLLTVEICGMWNITEGWSKKWKCTFMATRRFKTVCQ